MFGVGDFWLETTIIIKIESHPSDFPEDEGKKIQNGRLKKN
jgi:hypothetical protein